MCLLGKTPSAPSESGVGVFGPVTADLPMHGWTSEGWTSTQEEGWAPAVQWHGIH